MEEIIQALQLKAELDALRPIDKEQEDRIMQKFRLDWNYHSNHLEGNSLTYGETKALILHNITANGKPLKDHFEITGHNKAINWVIDIVSGERPLSQNFIRELHTLLLKESYEVDAQTAEGKPTKKRIAVGSYKITPNHVLTKTGEMFYFETPEETPVKMNDLLVWYENKCSENDLNPILLAAQFHYKFILIHPFDDGNGRTARILMNFILLKYGFPPCIIKSDKDSKDNYYRVLQLADSGNIEAFIEYIAQNVNRSLQIMIAGAKGENIEEDDDLDKEIALFEQRLNGFSAEVKEVKSVNNLADIIDNSIVELAKKIKEKFKVFEQNYVTTKVTIQINTDVEVKNNENSFQFPINEYLNHGFIYINYLNCKKEGLENFSFTASFDIYFNDLNYQIISYQIPEINFSKNYNQNLSKKEIDILVGKSVRHHIHLLEQKMLEIESQ